MEVKVCTWKTCGWKFSKYILTRLENDIKFYGWKNIIVEECLCLGHCKKWPNMKIEQETYNYVNPSKASELVSQKIMELKKIEENNSKPKKKK